MIVDGLAFAPLPKSLAPCPRVVDLRGPGEVGRPAPAGTRPLAPSARSASDAREDPGLGGSESCEPSALYPEYRMSITCPNPEETNSAVLVSFQVQARALSCCRRSPALRA